MKLNINKKFVYVACVIVLIGIVGYRVCSLIADGRSLVYNIVRDGGDKGLPVEYRIAVRETGVLREPLYVKNGRAYVGRDRKSRLVPGMRVGDRGRIVSVAGNIDYDTGMYLVRVSGADGGVHAYAERTGFFVPISAVVNDKTVLVAVDGIATPRTVTVLDNDADNAVVSGLDAGDHVILSNVAAGTRVRPVAETSTSSVSVKGE